tara:strand:+ start:1541 stop:2233 length:693 start_codon:yes stop_codon:yes gene_type:complete
LGDEAANAPLSDDGVSLFVRPINELSVRPLTTLTTLEGSITSLGTTSGHRFVVGYWKSSPIGPFVDVMWAPPGERRVLVASHSVAAYVTTVYPFSEFIDTPVSVNVRDRQIEVQAGPIAIRIVTGRPLPFPWRPRWFVGSVENALSQALLGVRTVGVSPTGMTEWYRTKSLSWIKQGTATVDGESCGDLAPITGHLGFGFTDPPRRPSHVALQVDIRSHSASGQCYEAGQ